MSNVPGLKSRSTTPIGENIQTPQALIPRIASVLAFFAEWSDPGQDMAKLGNAISRCVNKESLPVSRDAV